MHSAKSKPTATKQEIFAFILQELGIKLPTIESLGNGVVYCKLFETIYPASIQKSKLKCNPVSISDKVSNLQLLQKAFQAKGVKKQIEIHKLAECRFQDNLYMIQWLKQFYEDSLREVVKPQKKVKLGENSCASLPSFKNGSGFQDIFQTNRKEPKLDVDMSVSMLISPMILPSDIKHNKENLVDKDNMNSNIKRIDELFQKMKEEDEEALLKTCEVIIN